MADLWCERGHLNKDQAEFLKSLVEKQDPTNVLEIGFCTGRSASTILQAGKNIEMMLSIDIDLDYMKPEGKIFKEKLENAYESFHVFECNSKTLGDSFYEFQYDEGIDFAFVDGDHTFNGLMCDLTAILPHLNKGGMIVIDDYHSGPPNGVQIKDVDNACDYFGDIHPSLEKSTWHCQGKGFCIFKKV